MLTTTNYKTTPEDTHLISLLSARTSLSLFACFPLWRHFYGVSNLKLFVARARAGTRAFGASLFKLKLNLIVKDVLQVDWEIHVLPKKNNTVV